MAETVAPPPGFELVGNSTFPPPPHGFEIQEQKAPKQPVQPNVTTANGSLAKSIANAVNQALGGSEGAKAEFAPIEAVLNAGTAMVFGFPMYLGAGIGTLAARGLGLTDADPKEIASQYAEAVTYQAKTQAGKRLSDAVMLPLTALNSLAESGGHKVTDITGSPAAGALTEATIQMLPVPVIQSLARRLSGDLPTKQVIDDTAKVMTGDESGHVSGKLTEVYEKTGIDPQAVMEAAKTDPTIVQDLASSNRAAPEGLGVTIEPPKQNMVRMYHGGGELDGGPRWLTPDKTYAEGYAAKSSNAKVYYVDIPENSPLLKKSFDDTGTSYKAPYVSFEAPADIAKQLKPLDGDKPPNKPPQPPESGAPAAEPTPQEKVLSRIVTDVPEIKRTAGEWLHHIYTEYIDRYHPIAQAEAAAGGKLTFPEGVGPYEAQRLTAGVAGKAKRFIEFGPVDADTYKTNAPSYKAVMDMAKDDPKGFEAYIVAKHAIEREANGKATGIDLEAAKQVVADGAGKFEKASEARVKYKDALIDYAQKNGLLSEDSVAAMRDAYKAHVPFYRFFEGEEPATGAGKTPRSPVKRATGSERQILDPIASDIRDTFLFLQLSEANAARLRLLELGPEFVEKVKAPMKPIKITGDEMARALKEQGIDVDAEGFTAFRPQSYQAGKGEVVIFENGKRGIYKVNPDVAEAYNGLDAGSASLLSGMLRGTASLLRAGVTLSPDFAIRNVMRDSLSSFVYAGSHPIKTVRGVISYVKEDIAYQNWLQGGGANATMVAMDRRYIDAHLYEIEPQTHLLQHAWNVAKSPIEALRIMSETLENVTRLGIAVDDLKVAQTKAKIQALSMITREGTVDFARHGADPFLQQWTRATAFMNPAMQGADRMVRAFKDNPVGTTAKSLAAITIPSILLWASQKDDPRYKDMQDWERDLFWNVLTDKWELPNDMADYQAHAALKLTKEIDGKQYVNKGHIFRIPKPFELGVLFGSIPERILDAYAADKPDAFNNLGRSLKNIFMFNVMPTALLPIEQHRTNYNFFTDRPLVSDAMKALVPEYQFMPYTTEATKALAHLVGAIPGMHLNSLASPIVIDNYIRGWTGTLGAYAVDIADLALRKTGVLPDPIKPTKQLEEMPVIKALMVRYPSAGAQSIQDFYDNYSESQKVVATVRMLAQRGDAEAMKREINLDPSAMMKLDGIQQGLRNAQKVVQMIDQNQKFNQDEKRQLIDTIYLQMIAMARTGNEATQQIKKQLGTVTIH